MFDISKCKPMVVSVLFGGCAFFASVALAHPPHSPYDDSVFAPIKRFGPRVAVEVVASGLVAPVKGVAAPGHTNHLFVVDQVGKLWSVNLATGAKSVILDVGVTGLNQLVTLGVCGPDSFDERGLLGVAFHPNYQQNGLLYTYTSEPNSGPGTLPTFIPGTPDHQNVIAEWRVPNPGNPASVVNPASRRELIRVSWPQFNHNGSDLAFGPGGKLYISMGDGGSADDADGQDFVTAPPHHDICGNAATIGHQGDGNAQKLNTPLGKVLRIDVNPPFTPGKQYRVPDDNPFVKTTGAVREIWAFGFRNPYRFSFDSRSGALFLGDVGQNDIEEVDIVVRGGNYGWNVKEGTLFFHINGNADAFASRDPDPARVIPPRLIDPIAQYDTHHEGHSVIAGFVYRGRALHGLYGRFIFGEFSTIFNFPSGPHDYGRVLHMSGDPSQRGLRAISEFHIVGGNSLGLAVLGMGQDADGEVYITGNRSGLPFGTAGMVLKIVPAPAEDHDHGEGEDD